MPSRSPYDTWDILSAILVTSGRVSLEEECHQLDIRVRVEDNILEGGASYAHHVEALDRVKQIKPELDR